MGTCYNQVIVENRGDGIDDDGDSVDDNDVVSDVMSDDSDNDAYRGDMYDDWI